MFFHNCIGNIDLNGRMILNSDFDKNKEGSNNGLFYNTILES